jgi:hypothetical protein
MARKSTIKMWGKHRKSTDTKNKLKRYEEVRSSRPQNIIESTTVFDCFGTCDAFLNSDSVTSTDNASRKAYWKQDTSALDISTRLKQENAGRIYGNALRNKYTTIPYIDLLALPPNQRPSNFIGSLDFFYPMSGVKSHIVSQSPFISTFAGAYDVRRGSLNNPPDTFLRNDLIRYYRSKGVSQPDIDSLLLSPFSNKSVHFGDKTLASTNMPVDLGEVTLFYFYFSLYKSILVPSQLQNTQINNRPFSLENFFSDTVGGQSVERFTDSNVLQALKLTSGQEVANLGNIMKASSFAINLAGKIANDLATSDAENISFVNVLESVQDDPNFQGLLSIGVSFLTDTFVKQGGLNRKAANALASFAVNGAVNPQLYAELQASRRGSEDRELFTELKAQARHAFDNFAESQGFTKNGKLVSLRELATSSSNLKNKVTDFFVTGDTALAESILRTPTSNQDDIILKNVVRRKIKDNQKTYSKLFTQAFSDLSNKTLSSIISADPSIFNIVPIQSSTTTPAAFRPIDLSVFSRLNPSTLREGNARPNEAITLTTLGISAAVSAAKLTVSTLIDLELEEIRKNLADLQSYYTSRVHSLNSLLLESGISFMLDDFELVGAGRDTEFLDDAKWKVAPWCSLSQGGQLLDFMKYSACEMNKLHLDIKDAADQGGSAILDYFRNNFRADLSFYTQQERPFRTSVTSNDDPKTRCQTFDIFKSVVFKSFKEMLDDIESFSPFTQFYGFEPAFLDSRGSGKDELSKIRGGFELGIFGSPRTHGNLYMDASRGQWIAPEMKRTGKDKFASRVIKDRILEGSVPFQKHRAWKTAELQSIRPDGSFNPWWVGKDRQGNHAKTINSQRRLSDIAPEGYGGFTDLGFDVARDIPIFNAQWAALVSVIFSYPEALDNLASAGYDWAVRLHPIVQAELKKAVSTSTGSGSRVPTLRELFESGALDQNRIIKNKLEREFKNLLSGKALRDALKVRPSLPISIESANAVRNRKLAGTVIGVSAVGGLSYLMYKMIKD